MNDKPPAARGFASASTSAGWRQWWRPETRIAGTYLLAAVLWIYLSDRALLVVFRDPSWVNAFQTYKGLAFVTFTALLLFVLIRREMARRHRIEEALRASEARFRRVFESDMLGVIFWDRSGSITDANRVFLQMIGYDRADLEAGRVRWKDLTPPEHLHLDERALKEMEQTGACTPFEKEYIRRSGQRFPVLLGASFLEGSREQGVCFVLDITERRRAEAAVQASEERCRKLIESANDAILLADAETGLLLDANACAERLLGRRKQELIGQPQTILHPAEEAARYAQLFRDSVQRGEAVQEDIYVVHRDGRRVPVGVSASVFEAGGRRILQGIFRDLTERRRAETLLRVSEQRLQYAMQGANDGLWDWTLETGEVYFSDQWLRMLGYEPGDLQPHVSTWERLVHPDDFPQVRKVLDDHLEGRTEHYETEYRLRGKDGSWVWILDRGRVVERDRAGRPRRMAGTHTNLAERKRMEEALRENQRFLATLVGNLPGMVYRCRNDGDCTMTFVSDGCREVTGYTREELEQNRVVSFLTLVHPEDRELLWADCRKSSCGCTCLGEYRLFDKSGRMRWVQERSEGIYSEDGKLLAIEGFIQDISSRKRAEILSAGQNRALEMIATGHPLPSILEFLTGWMERVLPGTLCSILLLEEDGVTLRRGSDGCLPVEFCAAIDGERAAEGAGSCGAAVIRRAPVIVTDIATDPLWVSYRSLALQFGLQACWSVPVLSSTGRVVGTFANYYREVRAPEAEELQFLEVASALAGVAIERARAEAQIRKFNAELEQRVQQRTAQLEAANSELEAFSYSVSHDLRAPLRHVAGFSNLLLQQPSVGVDAGSKRMAQNIAGAALKMGRLIDDLLVFSRMGRTELNSQPINLTQLAGEVVAGLQQELGDRVVEWKLQPLPTVRGDQAMLRQVFENLLANAVKYTRDQPRATIEVTCDERSDELVLAIRDNGVGFDMQFAGKLFGVFQRLHREEDFEGTGIGLANVRRIVARHGGRTWAESQPNQGATFYFSLPSTSVVEFRN